MSCGEFVPRPIRRCSRSPTSGGAMNTSTESGSCRSISRAPGTSISRITFEPSASRRSTSLRSVPYRWPANSTCSRNSPFCNRRWNSSGERKWYSRPCCSLGRIGRVVAEVASSSRGTSARARAISVPLPTPDGPDTTNSRPLMRPQSFRQPADGLGLADPALGQQTSRAHPSQPRNRQQHVVDLRRQHVVRRVDQHLVERRGPRLERTLQLRSLDANAVRPVECVESLVEGTGGGLREERGHLSGR